MAAMNGFPNVQSLLSPGSPLPVDETVESIREIQLPEPGWAVQAVHKQQPAKESGMWSEANEKGTRLQGWKDSMDSLYDFAKFSTVCSECEQEMRAGVLVGRETAQCSHPAFLAAMQRYPPPADAMSLMCRQQRSHECFYSLDVLATLAQSEGWTLAGGGEYMGHLKHYLSMHFLRLVEEGKVLQCFDHNGRAQWATFNTGLLSLQGEEFIFALLQRSPLVGAVSAPWQLYSFATSGQVEDPTLIWNKQEAILAPPEPACFFEDPLDLMLLGAPDAVHLHPQVWEEVEDHVSSFPVSLQDAAVTCQDRKQAAVAAMTRAFQAVAQNPFAAVPMIQRVRGPQQLALMLLLPLKLDPHSPRTHLALALETSKSRRGARVYRATQILRLEKAYAGARVVMPVHQSWLAAVAHLAPMSAAAKLLSGAKEPTGPRHHFAFPLPECSAAYPPPSNGRSAPPPGPLSSSGSSFDNSPPPAYITTCAPPYSHSRRQSADSSLDLPYGPTLHSAGGSGPVVLPDKRVPLEPPRPLRQTASLPAGSDTASYRRQFEEAYDDHLPGSRPSRASIRFDSLEETSPPPVVGVVRNASASDLGSNGLFSGNLGGHLWGTPAGGASSLLTSTSDGSFLASEAAAQFRVEAGRGPWEVDLVSDYEASGGRQESERIGGVQDEFVEFTPADDRCPKINISQLPPRFVQDFLSPDLSGAEMNAEVHVETSFAKFGLVSRSLVRENKNHPGKWFAIVEFSYWNSEEVRARLVAGEQLRIQNFYAGEDVHIRRHKDKQKVVLRQQIAASGTSSGLQCRPDWKYTGTDTRGGKPLYKGPCTVCGRESTVPFKPVLNGLPPRCRNCLPPQGLPPSPYHFGMNSALIDIYGHE